MIAIVIAGVILGLIITGIGIAEDFTPITIFGLVVVGISLIYLTVNEELIEPIEKEKVCSLIYINPEEGVLSIEECALDYDITIIIDGVTYEIEGKSIKIK